MWEVSLGLMESKCFGKCRERHVQKVQRINQPYHEARYVKRSYFSPGKNGAGFDAVFCKISKQKTPIKPLHVMSDDGIVLELFIENEIANVVGYVSPGAKICILERFFFPGEKFHTAKNWFMFAACLFSLKI